MNISFGQPIFLWGLLSIGVPIWLHFIHRRSISTIFFSDIRVLKGTPTQGKGFRFLHDLGLLLFRILALVALVLAFSEPKNVELLNDHSSKTYLYLDNHVGFMEGNRTAFNLVETELPRSSKPVYLLLNSFQSVDFEIKTWNDIHELWPGLKMSKKVANPKSVMDRIKEIQMEQNRGSVPHVIWVSDFPQSNPWPDFPKDFKVDLVPVKRRSLANIVVDSVSNNASQMQRGQPFNLKGRIKNRGSIAAIDQKMSLYLDDFPISAEKINLKVGESKWLDFGISLADKKAIKAKLISDDAVLFDNVYSFLIEKPEPKDVYVLEGMPGEKYLSKVFANDSLFDLHVVNQQSLLANLSNLKGFLILSELNKFSDESIHLIYNWVKSGNSFVLIPNAQINNGMMGRINSNFSGQGNSFKQEVSSQAMAVRLPIKNTRFFNSILEQSSFKKKLEMFNSNSFIQWNGGIPIFEYVNGKPFLSEFHLGSGSMFVFSGDITKEADSFFKHGLFLPVLHEMALSNHIDRWSATIFSQRFEISAPKTFKFSNPESAWLTFVKGKQSWIPEQKWAGNKWICAWPDLLERNFSGFWQLSTKDKKTLNLAVNYPLNESEIQSFSSEEIQDHYRGNPNVRVSRMKDIQADGAISSDLSFYFFMASLCFFLIEMAIVFYDRFKFNL